MLLLARLVCNSNRRYQYFTGISTLRAYPTPLYAPDKRVTGQTGDRETRAPVQFHALHQVEQHMHLVCVDRGTRSRPGWPLTGHGARRLGQVRRPAVQNNRPPRVGHGRHLHQEHRRMFCPQRLFMIIPRYLLPRRRTTEISPV